MENIPLELFQISPLAIVVIFAIREVFIYLRSRRNGQNYPTKEGCELRHGFLNKEIGNIHETLSDIKENHLQHIEKDIKTLRENQVKIFQILEDRLPPKK